MNGQVVLAVVAYPGLCMRALTASWPAELGAMPAPPWLLALLAMDGAAPMRPDEHVRRASRDLLRRHGYRPTGRGKPSAEYLAAAATAGRLASINVAVDAGNAVSLHSGVPISIVDLDQCRPPLRVDVPGAGSEYVFNQSGQRIEVGGLLSLFDRDGPCANAVKDAQRTKTGASTRRVLALLWGATVDGQSPAEGESRADRAASWLAELLVRLGAALAPVAVSSARASDPPAPA
jgi:DNA/RNA-binding domain of Phe-tRNA-synthetase-like protein